MVAIPELKTFSSSVITIAEMAVFGEVILRSPLYVLGVIVSDQDSYIIIARNDQEEVKIKIEDIQS